ncbi:MAG TPA: FtsX-like permease family protein, partial [Puia sp.]|nr:FtsX-like permease family protein [Puia sp.]
KLTLPYVNHLSDRQLSFSLFTHPATFLLMMAGAIGIGLISGLYPAAFLSSFQPVKVLKGSLQTGRNKSLLRNILVIGQFTTAIFLMIATVFLVRQLNYMESKDPGFNRSQVVTIPLDGITYKKYDDFKQDLLSNSLIQGVTASQDQLGSHLDQSGIEFKGDGPKRDLTSTRLIVDPDYLTLYHIQLLLGNNFSHDKNANGKEYIINESLAKELLKDNSNKNYNSLLHKQFGFDSSGYIVGIAKDFNFNSLHYKIETMFLFNQKEWGLGNASVRIDGNHSQAALAYIQSVWQKNYLDHPFEYQFLDDHFAELYQADNQTTQIVGFLAILAIFISCLGLFGMASYAAEKRIKEIGIRKVLGASVQRIVTMLSFDFLKFVLIATLIAWPLAWYCVNLWMQNFAYRSGIVWWVFAGAGMAALVIALITISLQALKAATANPVESLRSE